MDTDQISTARETLLDAVLPHVAFDGWSRASLEAALAETGVERSLADLAFPRGGIDMALAFHRRGDRELAALLQDQDLGAMRVRERITHAVRKRIELVADQREAVRRGAALFALPPNSAEGMRAIWETADLIWTHCGDTATDYNWYTKRMILSSVYSSTILYWLGDEDPRAAATWEFLDRRIEDVMRIEQVKASMQGYPLTRALLWGPMQVLERVRAPRSAGAAESGW